MLLEKLGLPEKVIGLLKAEGITELNPPQVAAVKKGLLEGKNLVVASPTASGKTLIAEIAILKNFLDGKKSVYLVPLKALASEKYNDFSKYRKIGMRVAVATGDLDGTDGWLGSYDLIIMSNEKMDSLLRHGVPWTKDISLIVADEIHLIDDASRGPTLEIVLTQLAGITKSQLIALSATIENSKEIAEWLDAKLVESDYRPVKLHKGIMYPDSGQHKVEFRGRKYSIPSASEIDTDLCIDTIQKGKQALVFASTRRNAEAAAERISKDVRKLLQVGERRELKKLADEVENALGSPTKQCRRLARIIENGSAFHHAGLVAKQRKLIEDAFRSGAIKVMVATSTLCLDKKSLIWNGTSEIKINEAKNHNVLALKSKSINEIPIHKITSMPAPEEMVEITSVAGNKITVTQNHRMLIKSKNTAQNIEAELCNIGDKIATAGRIRVAEITNPKWSDFIKDNKFPFEDRELDRNIFYLIGAFLGDGYSGGEFKDGRILYKGSPCIAGEDIEVFKKIKEICEPLSIHCRECRNSYGTPQLILTKSNWFREFLVRCGIDTGKRKCIHRLLTHAEQGKLSYLVRGLFDTDGCVEKRGGISFSNSSINLINDVKKSLLRFGIVSVIREREESSMKIYGKEYITQKKIVILIFHSRCILDFQENIGFSIDRKRTSLESIINKINSNILSIHCKKCDYLIKPNFLNPRSKPHKDWSNKRLEIIKYLGENGERKSYLIKRDLGFVPWKCGTRLNSHFDFINRKRVGNSSLWSLNKIGEWLYSTIKNNGNINWFLDHEMCPLCKNAVIKTKRGNWRKYDFEGDIYWDIIKSIKRVKPSSPKVYDVVLPDDGSNDHHFVSNGFIVHNSYGLNLPAYRVAIKDTKRFNGSYGMSYLPVIDINQMAGRAGRPKYDSEGEAILLAKSKGEAKQLWERYIDGDAEPIYSKLGVERTLRIYILSLVSSGYVKTKSELENFFMRTFFAKQYGDIDSIRGKIERIIEELESYKFILVGDKGEFISKDFMPAFQITHDMELRATKIGKRVSELYIDPVSANFLLSMMSEDDTAIQNLMTVCQCIEMKPLLTVRKSEYESIESELAKSDMESPDVWDVEYEDFLSSFKTALMLKEWTEESGEDKILEKFGVAPGELYNKATNAEWVLYAASELAMLLGIREIANNVNKVRLQVKHGVREELLKLVTLKGIGRVRARRLYSIGIRSAADIKKADETALAKLLGPKIAKEIRQAME